MNTFLLYQLLPEEAYVGKKIPLDFFLRYGDIGAATQTDFRYLYVDARSMFVFRNPSSIENSVKDSGQELHVIEFRILHTGGGIWTTNKMVRTIIQAIPHHVFLVLRCGNRLQCFAATTHRGIRRYGKNVVDAIHYSGIIDIDDVRQEDKDFFDNAVHIFRTNYYNDWKHKQLMFYMGGHNVVTTKRREDKAYNDYTSELNVSKNELLRDMEFGYVPADWRRKFELKDQIAFYDALTVDDAEDG